MTRKDFRRSVAVVGAACMLCAPARAADIGELSKYLAFIEGFQHLYEFCQAETQLPAEQVIYARNHIAERGALVFAGLNESQRDQVMADTPAKKKQMLEGVTQAVKKDNPNASMPALCKQGFFEGVIKSERGSEAKEVAAIQKAKQ
jgi:hypothetical protein